ncbi:MAG: class I SAM-dependent methyltransferase [Candidatus Methanoperedens sp.]
MNIRSWWKKRNEDLILNGKISFLNPYKIENQSILEAMINAKKYAYGNILDMGCGNKPYAHIFREEKYIGIDLPVSESANKEDKKADIHGSVLELPFRPNSFDTVISLQVLEHVPEPQKMLEEAYRVLKKDGCLILTAPMTWGLHEIPNDYYRFTRYGLKYLAETLEFKIVYINERCGFWGMIGQRLSSWTYHFRGAPSSLITEMIKRITCAFIQAFFLSLDRLDRQEGDTLGYVMVARK